MSSWCDLAAMWASEDRFNEQKRKEAERISKGARGADLEAEKAASRARGHALSARSRRARRMEQVAS